MDNVRTIEDLDQDAAVGLINSPRSLEACLRTGYAPNELLPSIPKPTTGVLLPPELENARVEHLEERRRLKVAAVKEERLRIIAYLNSSHGGDAHPETMLARPAEMSQPDAAATDPGQAFRSSKVALEYKRLQVIKRRQQKELGRMIAAEEAVQETHKKLVAAEEFAHQQKKIFEKEKRKREQEAQNKREKLARDKEEAARQQLEARQRLAEQEAAREAGDVTRALEAEKALKKRIIANDMLRREKHAERQRKIEEMIQKQEEAADEKRKQMEQREQRLKAQIDVKLEKMSEERETRRKRAAQRIQSALERQQEIKIKKLNDFEARQAAAKLRHEEKMAEELEVVKKNAKKLEEKHTHRQARMAESRLIMADRKEKIIETRKRKDRAAMMHLQQRDKETMLRKFDFELSQADKMSNLQRIRRVQEFQRLQLLQKIQEGDDRSDGIKAEREYLQEQRRQATHQAFIRKFKIKEAMEAMAVTNKFSDLQAVLNQGGEQPPDKEKEDAEEK